MNKEYKNTLFLKKIATQLTLISSCVFNKSILKNIEPYNYCGSNLVQTNFYIQSIMSRNTSYYFSDFMIAYKKNNSGGYNLFQVFAVNFGDILDNYIKKGFISSKIKRY